MHEDERRALQALGLALRAGRVAVGTRAVKEAADAGELRLLVLARDATDNALGRLRGALERSGAARLRCGTRADIGEALGRGPVAAVGVTDRSLADRIRTLAPDETTSTIHTS